MDTRKQDELTGWLNSFLVKAEILSPTLVTLPHYAEIRHELKTQGTPIPASDCWIAALVREHKMSIVSRDTHFDLVKNISRLDW